MSKTIAWAEGTFTNVTEPFTVMLTNEAQQFATDSNRKVTSAQSYYTDIIVIRGSQERITRLEILLLAVESLSVRVVKELHLV